MRTLLVVIAVMMAAQFGVVDKVETTPTGTLITYQDGTGYYIGK